MEKVTARDVSGASVTRRADGALNERVFNQKEEQVN